jgi:Asp-tRNA(Asn)/Glu-tRNA(Gln) amidotransferase C subunit
VQPCLPLDEVLANAPASEDGYFVVPPVIEGE